MSEQRWCTFLEESRPERTVVDLNYTPLFVEFYLEYVAFCNAVKFVPPYINGSGISRRNPLNYSVKFPAKYRNRVFHQDCALGSHLLEGHRPVRTFKVALGPRDGDFKKARFFLEQGIYY